MSKHSSLGASSSHRWMACPGSVNLSEGMPRKGSIYADEGTAAHELAARCLQNNGLDAIIFLDTVIQTDDMETAVRVTDEMTEAVQVYVDYVRKLQTEDGFELIGIEKQFDLAPLNPPAPMWGRADAVLFRPPLKPRQVREGITLAKPSVLEVVDFKYGAGTVVVVEKNTQGLYYAIGAVLATGRSAGNIRVTIAQPRAAHPEGIVRSWDCSWDELVAFRQELLAGAVATQQDDAPLHTGDHCRFCPALAVCPAQADLAQATAKTAFKQIAVTDEFPASEARLPVPEALGLEELRNVMRVAPTVTDWLKAVMEHMRDLTEAGVETGYKLVPKRGRRLWKDETEVEQVLTDRLGSRAFSQKLLSVTQAEKVFKLLGPDVPPEFAELWAMVSSGTNLVPNADPRTAIAPPPKPTEVFEVHPEVRDEPETVFVELADGTHEVREVSAERVVVLDSNGQIAAVLETEDGPVLEVPEPGSEREQEMDAAMLASIGIGLEPVGMTDAEIEGLADEPTAYADSKNFEETSEALGKVVTEFEDAGIDLPGEEITEPIEPEVVEYSVTQEEYTPNEQDVQLWQITVPGGDPFYVEASNAAEAKTMAREELKVERLPNHTTVSLS